MIVRESPNSKIPTSHVQWPPKSPLDAVLCSPNGRKKVREMMERSVSPSPIKRRRREPAPPTIDEDDDEETLQLKLQAIEARLRLKELQKAKAKEIGVDTRANEVARGRTSRSDNQSGGQSRDRYTSPVHSTTEVPASPKLREIQAVQPESPRRVQLGIDKGLTAKEISLRKPRASKPMGNIRRQPTAPIKSFSQKLAEARSMDDERHQKQERLKQARSRGFGVEEVKHEETLPSFKHPAERRPQLTDEKGLGMEVPASTRYHPLQPSQQIAQREIENTSQLEPFSKFALSRRVLSESTISTALTDKEIFSIPRLLKTVTSPHYDPPDTSDDYVVLGIIASKSSAHDTAPSHKTSTADSTPPPATKFMAIKLTDLEWSLDLFLFDTAFDRFWKLTVGTVVAILNPGIMPPKPHLRDTGAFSLKLVSSEDTVLELGAARDLAFCKSVKRDGKVCGQWVDGRRTEFCEFHVNLQVEKTKAGRMEINSMIGLSALAGGAASKRGGSGGGGRGGGRGRGNGRGAKAQGAYYDHEAHEKAYAVPREFSKSTQSATTLLDAEDYLQGGLSKAERSRKRIAAHQKERDIMAKLGSEGDGLGREYAQAKRGSDEASARREKGEVDVGREEGRDAASLGLVRTDAAGVRLSPAKGGKSWAGHAGEGGAGWSKAFQNGLPRQKDQRGGKGGRDVDDQAPVAKKARVEKQVEVAAKRPRTPIVDDDDDGLDII